MTTSGTEPDTGAPIPYVDPVRRDLQRRKAIRDTVIASVSIAVVVVAGVALVTSAAGWPLVRDTFFSGEQIGSTLPEIIRPLTEAFIQGAGLLRPSPDQESAGGNAPGEAGSVA